MPYDDGDERLFFGRGREVQIIISNLFAARLTTLYGISGVGKSSVLGAGVVSRLRARAKKAMEDSEPPDVAVVYFKEWQRGIHEGQGEDGLIRLKKAIQHSLNETLSLSRTEAPSQDESLRQVIQWATDRLNGDLMIILDQFEEYFLYHPRDDYPRSFAAEFVEAVNDSRLPVSFLLSIRGDSLSTLDRFKGKIPNLFSNSLRLKPLTSKAAREAILKPLEVYNQMLSEGDRPMTIDEELVRQVIADVPIGHSLVRDPEGLQSRQSASSIIDDGIETPYLQLVLTRLWDEERRRGSTSLTLELYRALGKAKGIVKSHLDHIMDTLVDQDRHAAASILRHLITPSGTKIALNESDLAAYTKIDPKLIGNVLRILSGPKMRILASVTDHRHELFHDALAPAVLDWLARFTLEQEKQETTKRAEQELAQKRKRYFRVAVGIVVLFGFITSYSWMMAKEAELKATELELRLQQQEAERIKQEARRSQELRKADVLIAQGSRSLLNQDFRAALSSFKNAHGLFTQFGHEPGVVKALVGIGKTHALRESFLEAREVFQEALQLARNIEDRQLEGLVLERLGAIEEQNNQLSSALELYAQAEQAYAKANDLQGRGRILERLAVHADESGHSKNAIQIYQTVVTSYRSAGDQTGLARAEKALRQIESLYKPWGYLVNLHTGTIHDLKGNEIKVGRNVATAQLRNDISFSNKVVSRRHLVIRRDLSVEDLRSLNGTTINARFLFYGVPSLLNDGDVIALAYYRALQFRKQRPATTSIPEGTWGIFIENSSKTFQYLHDNRYSVSLVGETLVVQRGEKADALMKIRWNNQLEMLDVPDEWELRYYFKVGDYDFRNALLEEKNSGVWLKDLALPLQYQILDSQNEKVLQDGPFFQIIPF